MGSNINHRVDISNRAHQSGPQLTVNDISAAPRNFLLNTPNRHF